MKPLYLPPEPEPEFLLPETLTKQIDALTAQKIDRAEILDYASVVWKQTTATLQALQKGDRNSGLFKGVARLAGFTSPPWSAWTAEQIRAAVTPIVETWDPTAQALHLGTIERGLKCTDPAALPPGMGLFGDLEKRAAATSPTMGPPLSEVADVAERHLLGSILLDPAILEHVALPSASFHNQDRRRMFEAFRAVGTDLVAVLKHLGTREAPLCGWPEVYADLRNAAPPSAANWREYETTILDGAEDRRAHVEIGRAVDRLARGESPRETLARLRDAQIDTADRSPWSRAKRLPQQWLDEAPPPLPMLLTLRSNAEVGHMPRGKVGLLASHGGVGKTSWLTQLAVSIATGHELFEWFCVPSSAVGGVFLALAEEDEPEVWRRVRRRVVDHLDPPLTALEVDRLRENLTVAPLAGADVRLVDDTGATVTPTPAFTALKRLLLATAPPSGWRLIILDPGVLFAGRESEKDNASAAAFMNQLAVLTELPGNPSVMMALHTNKQSAQNDVGAVRGSSAFVDQARWVAQLSRGALETLDGEPVEGIAYQVTKTNYTNERETRFLDYGGVGQLQPHATATGFASTKAAREKKQDDAHRRATDAHRRATNRPLSEVFAEGEVDE